MTMTRRAIATLAVSLPLLAGGCVSPPENEQSAGNRKEGSDSEREATGRGERGGPADVEVDGEPILKIGGVKTEATANDTIELFTRPTDSDQDEPLGDASPDWTSRLRITFTSAARDGVDITFHGTAAYLHDEGAYVIHSMDFSVLLPEEQAAASGDGTANPGFRTFTAEAAEPLATLTQDKPEQEFDVTIAGVPEEDEAMRLPDGLPSRYVQYETPETLWGHKLDPPDDFTPGRLCYGEGDAWHDVELFEFTDIPCG
ncbi:hypothetical protein [Nocardiopsis rhodophaea]|uniref:hypothetical protein n=1 Tax=Nocardiopsis rhodophaea TaxID=280238 RepID=UPI0031D32C93